MTARSLLWDGLVTGGVLALMYGSLALTLAAIGTLDGERRPLAAARAWLRRLPVIGLLCPEPGRHIAEEPRGEVGDSDQLPRRVGDHPGAWPLPQRAGSGGSIRGAAPPEADRDGGRQLGDTPDACAAAAADDDLTGLSEEDTDTLRAIREINADHLVPVHEPKPPGPDGLTAPPPRAAAGEASGPGDDLDALDVLIEQHRQSTAIDPRLLPAIRAALGFESVECYLDSMRRKLTAGAA